RRHTMSKRGWSSDVCSSDLGLAMIRRFSASVMAIAIIVGPSRPAICREPVTLTSFHLLESGLVLLREPSSDGLTHTGCRGRTEDPQHEVEHVAHGSEH